MRNIEDKLMYGPQFLQTFRENDALIQYKLQNQKIKQTCFKNANSDDKEMIHTA